MTRPEIVPFTPEHLDAAGTLLAGRHRSQRVALPSLPSAYEEEAAARTCVAALVAEGATGVAAVHGGDVVGYLVARTRSTGWGRNAWVDPAGHAVAARADARDLVPAMYAAGAGWWVEAGRRAHYVMVPAHDPELAGAWFRLGFGHQHTQALRELSGPPGPPGPAGPPRRVDGVRTATPADLDALAGLEVEHARRLVLSPVFSSHAPVGADDARAGLEEELADPDVVVLVAEQGGVVVGSAVGCPAEHSSLHEGLARPANAAATGPAVVLPGADARAVGPRLGEAMAGWAAGSGYDVLVTDWREAEPAAREWRARGYRDSFWRLHRLVGY